jgi:glycerol-3-phosphate dehydrogenase
VDYLLEAANHFFPDARLTRQDVVSAWAGLRPLAAQTSASTDPGSASREHAITERVPGLVSVTGGKLTTYRAMASEVVDAVQRSLGLTPTPSSTARTALVGGEIADLASEVSAATDAMADAATATRLVHAHGSAWRAVLELGAGEPTLAHRVESSRPYLLAELCYAVNEEHAMTLGDLLIRRTPIAFETRDHGRAAAQRVAPFVSQWLGWSAARTAAEIADYDAEVQRIFRIEGG